MEVVRIGILMIWNYMLINGEIMCNYQPLPWKSAIAWCQNKTGILVGSDQIHIPYGIPKDASFWTPDYTTRKLHVSSIPDYPVACGYRTFKLNMFGSIEFGDCSKEKHYICCQSYLFGERCVQTGTWQRAIMCTTSTYQDNYVRNMVPDGDYWVAHAYAYETNTLRGDINNLPMPDQCGSVHSNGILHFENNCSSLRYSMCDLPDHFLGFSVFSECDRTHVPTITERVSSTDSPTARAHVKTTISPTGTLLSKTASKLKLSSTLLTTIQTNSRSTYRRHPYMTTEQYALFPARTTVSAPFSNKNVSKLNIGLGIGLGCLVIIIAVIALSCYIRRNTTRRDADKRTVTAHAEMNATYAVPENRVNLTHDNPCQISANNDAYFSNSAIGRGRSHACYEETCTDSNGVRATHQEHYSYCHDIYQKRETTPTNKYKDDLKIGSNELMTEFNVAMNTLYFTSKQQEDQDHEYCNTDVMSDQYDGVHFSEAPDSVTLNEYSHIGFGKQYNHDENDYNVAFSKHEQAGPYMSDYDTLNHLPT
ncbi:uncharacterized protein LOC127842562 isoform X2 [Dreissena polymorpha]|uniref:uncharacterized protein LOC127842562 isoform X2 n=1 Tax=Dreissena polymorpha TaxID=45954 RepID=UPI002263F057|nr:uncharacterized protein LOC127842562 isoform X2 [Dreissena polymorpha]